MIQTKTCDCGAPVEVEIPGDLPPRMQEMLRRWGVQCNACAERAERERVERERAEARREADVRWRNRVAASEMPQALRGLTWDTLELTGRRKAIDAAQAWARGDQDGLLLSGAIGVGKTRIAATAAWAMLERRFLRWSSVPVLFARLGAGHGEQARKAALELLTGRGALVLDDLDKVRPTEYGAEQVFAVLDNRITNGDPLLVTTNLSLEDLAAKFPDPFGDAIASRLAGYCRVQRLGGRDRRVMQAAA